VCVCHIHSCTTLRLRVCVFVCVCVSCVPVLHYRYPCAAAILCTAEDSWTVLIVYVCFSLCVFI